MDNLDVIEAQANKLANFRLETMELLNKRAHSLVTLLLGGAGAMGAYGAGLIERHAPWVVVAPVLTAALWLFLVAAVAVFKCLRTLEVVPPGHDPSALLEQDCVTDDLRRGVLTSLQGRMAAWAARNVQQAVWLDHCYAGAAATPLPAIASALVSLWLYPGALA